MVIQGPPGTGKSQTITNLISAAVVAGERVLFVSEKMAALEVVKRRLDHIGVGDACLELHSNKTNKKAVLDELKRTLELGKPQVEGVDADLQLLEQQRDRLNAYCEAVNEPIASSSLSPYVAMGHALHIRERLTDSALPSMSIKSATSWDAVEFRRLEILVREMQARLQTMGPPMKHPFWGSKRTTVLPGERGALQASLQSFAAAVQSLRASLLGLTDLLRTHQLPTMLDAGRLVELANRLLVAPPLVDIDVDTPLWLQRENELRQFVEAASRLASAHAAYSGKLVPEAWTADLAEIRDALATHKGQWWRFLSGEYRRAAASAAALSVSPPASPDEALALVEAIVGCQRDSALSPHWLIWPTPRSARPGVATKSTGPSLVASSSGACAACERWRWRSAGRRLCARQATARDPARRSCLRDAQRTERPGGVRPKPVGCARAPGDRRHGDSRLRTKPGRHEPPGTRDAFTDVARLPCEVARDSIAQRGHV